MPFYRPARNAQRLSRIHIVRKLGRPGRVLVKPGDRVGPLDRIAVRARRHQLRLLSVTEALRVPASRAMQYIRCRPGQMVAEGDILAEKPGLFARRLKAPFRGRVLFVGQGTIILQQVVEEEVLLAGIAGEVEEVLPKYGARIVASGLYLTGLWGNNRIDGGLGTLTQAFPTGRLEEDAVTLEHRGSVLVAQSVAGIEVLRRGEEAGIKGLILAYLEPPILDAARQVTYPIVLLEGFTETPFAESVIPVLQSLDRRDVVLCAEPPQREQGRWPWIFSPQESYEALHRARNGAPLEANATVRILRGRYRGRTGLVLEVYPDPRGLPSGVQGYMVKLRVDETLVEVPVTNVELLD